MITTETIEINGKEFKRTYSTTNKIIKKIGTNEEYSEAVDLMDSVFTYDETDKEIEESENEQI